MSKEKICLLAVLSLVSATVFAVNDGSLKFQNTVRFGYDDNIYQAKDKQGSASISDILNITGKMTFSERSELLFFWQPEFKYRFDADPESVTYQDLYGRFSHGISENVFFQISDRFRYQDKGAEAGAVDRTDENFVENNLVGGVDFTLSKKDNVKLGAEYNFRKWDDKNYGKTRGNDYDQFVGNASYLRELKPNKTTGLIGVNYVDQSYEGSRGGYSATALYLGVDQNFTPTVTGNFRVGGSYSSVDTGMTDNDAYAPYLQGTLLFQTTEDTSFTGSIGYSVNKSENSVYNAQDRFNVDFGMQHKLTGKVTLYSTLGYQLGLYDADYKGSLAPAGLSDAKENLIRFTIRSSYEINKNNFVDIGYQYVNRDVDVSSLTDYDRNRVDIGWRVRF